MKRQSKQGRKGSRSKYIAILAVITVVLIIVVAMIPFLTNIARDYFNEQDYKSRTETPGTITNGTEGPNLDKLSPNYSLNITADKTYEINDASYLDYKEHENCDSTKYSEPYNAGDAYTMRLIVTNETGTAIPSQKLVITAQAEKTGGDGVAVGGILGIIVGGLIGAFTLGIGAAIVLGVAGGCIGAGIGFVVEGARGTTTFFENATVTADQGDSLNEVQIAAFDKGFFSTYNFKVDIALAPDTVLHYAEFASSPPQIVTDYSANIYIRLVATDNHLLQIQQDIKNDTVDYNGWRSPASVESAGLLDATCWDPAFNGHDAFRGVDTANDSEYGPTVSRYDNNHVFAVHEKRMIQAKNIAGVELRSYNPINYPDAYFAFRMFIYDEVGNLIEPDGGDAWGMSYNMNNDNASLGGFDNEVLLSNLDYCTVSFTYHISIPGTVFYSVMSVVYKFGGAPHVELLGSQIITLDHAQYISSFKYKYNMFFGTEQTVHRQIYNTNDKYQIFCMFNAPFYLNESYSDFTVRFFFACPTAGDSDTLFATPHNNYPFKLVLTVLDGDTVVLNDSQTVWVPTTGLAGGYFHENMAGISELKSYELRISAYSEIPATFLGGGRVVATYAKCLYYTLKNYDEFMSDIKDIEDFLAALTDKSKVASGTYDQLKEIMGVIKSKISDLEGSLSLLKAQYNNDYSSFRKCEKAIKNFKDSFVLLSAFMDKNTADAVSQSDTLYSDFRALIYDIKMWYSDSFTEYNFYIADLKGEHGVSNDGQNLTKGYEDEWQKRHDALRNSDLNKYLPSLVVAFAFLIAALLTGIFYFLFRNKTKSKWVIAIASIAVFCLSAVILYIFFLSISWTLLQWFYGV